MPRAFTRKALEPFFTHFPSSPTLLPGEKGVFPSPIERGAGDVLIAGVRVELRFL
jgi:hypothetical protein